MRVDIDDKKLEQALREYLRNYLSEYINFTVGPPGEQESLVRAWINEKVNLDSLMETRLEVANRTQKFKDCAIEIQVDRLVEQYLGVSSLPIHMDSSVSMYKETGRTQCEKPNVTYSGPISSWNVFSRSDN